VTKRTQMLPVPDERTMEMERSWADTQRMSSIGLELETRARSICD